MKRLFYLIAIILLAMTFVSNSQAQMIEPFKALDGLEKAKGEAIAKGIASPQLIFVGTFKRTLIWSGLQISVDFNMNDGKSNVWCYIFRSPDDPQDIRAVAISKVILLGDYMPYPVPDSIMQELTLNYNETLEGINWYDSDVMAGHFRQNQEFMDYYNAHPNPDKYFVILAVNSEYDFLEKGQPYWAISMTVQQETKVCAAQALTGSFACGTLGWVNNNNGNNDNSSIYPNPASDNINIKLPYNYSNAIGKFMIFSSIGVKVGEADIINGESSIQLDYYNAGLYFAKYNAGAKTIAVPFIVSK